MRCGESIAPAGSMERGWVVDPASVGQALRQLLARTEISATRALIVASDAIASFRVMTFANGIADSEVDAVVTSQLPTPTDRMALRRKDILRDRRQRTVYAVAWDRGQVQSMAEAARVAGLDPAVVELKSLCVARAIPKAACILLDMSTDPCEAVLIVDHVPRIWHAFKVPASDDRVTALSAGLKPLLAFHKQSGGDLSPDAPVLVRTEQLLAAQLTSDLSEAVGHPVELLEQPPRIEPEVRFGPFLPCIGLVMRRG